MLRVIVTRPAVQAADWVRRLGAEHIDAVALPLIGVAPAADAAAVEAAWATLATQRLVVFVSPNAVEHFFAGRPAAMNWPAGVLAGSPGPGTTRALLDLGVPAAQTVAPAADAAQFDSEALWQQIAAQDWQGAPVLIVRGDGGRDWLADTLRGRGAQVGHVAAYRREAPVFDTAQRALLAAALGEPASHLWYFSSSEAIDHLERVSAAFDPPRWAEARALATHPRIAERARRLGIARVTECRPPLEAVVACIQSLRS
ncbi:MAG: uroporphyrinogen-III synthase [Burkholderiaceae bacterium]